MTRLTTDFLIIGGGIIGLGLALEARRRHPTARVTLVEKEPDCGLHASGRNSGVLHAGFYYSADTLKARFTREGNRRLTEYCLERGLRINRCGKLVVARTASDLAGLDELLRRARTNGIELHEVSAAEARAIEPRARTHERALFSPTTASVDPREVVASLADDARAAGVRVLTGTAYLGRDRAVVQTTGARLTAGYVINAAGLYADRVARDFGFSRNHRILPFKGLYLHGVPGRTALRTNVYPVPDLANPFLGIHFTVTVDGRVKIGPTAVPAFWRENYRGCRSFDLREFLEIASRVAALLLRDDFGFRALALREARKYRRRRLVREAAGLVAGIGTDDFPVWGTPGIRAQLFDLRERRLETDFCFEGDRQSFHVLNAVSPAFTCSIPFCAFLFQQIDRLLA